MSSFDRRLPGLDDLLDRASAEGPDWFADLLSHWRPAGHGSGADGLRLAIRNGSLNFYRLGQSVARVSVGRGGPKADIHIKYIAEGALEQRYARLGGGRITCNGWGDFGSYAGTEMLGTWIERAGKHAGDEKKFVDRVVAHNANVIDLEMGLPAFVPKGKTKAVAPRMDIVALEPFDAGYRLVFWEAKLMGDGRLRARNGAPEVLRQLADYSDWMGIPGRIEAVKDAYRRNCILLVALQKAAAGTGDWSGSLGAGIEHVAHHGLKDVDIRPRLLIDDQAGSTSWAAHEDRLAGITTHYVRGDEAADFLLPVGA